MSANLISSAHAQTGLQAKSALLEWIPVNRRLCAARLHCSTNANGNRLKRCYSLIVSVYAPIDCSSPELKDDLYRELPLSFRSMRSTDIVDITNDHRAQYDYSAGTERRIRGRFSVFADRGSHYPSLFWPQFVSGKHQTLSWESTSVQLEPYFVFTAMDCHWSIEDSTSFFFRTFVRSNHASVPARLCLQQVSGYIGTKTTYSAQLTLDDDRQLRREKTATRDFRPRKSQKRRINSTSIVVFYCIEFCVQ